MAERLSSTSAVLSADVYDSYGASQTTATQAALASDPFGYGAQHGYYTDRETGFVLCGHRYYDTAYGRWLTRDPAGVAGGINLYQYVGGNPVNESDPAGLSYVSDEWDTWRGIASVANPVNWYNGIAGLSQIAGSCGFGAAGNAAVQGISNSFSNLFTTTNCYQGGQSIGTWATAAAGGAGLGYGIAGGWGAAGGGAADATADLGAVGDAGTPSDVPTPVYEPTAGQPVWRVWGGKSGPNGGSWSPVDPASYPNYRDTAGLPDVNSGEYVSQGTLNDPTDVTYQPADPLDGNAGGAPEYRVPNASNQITVTSTTSANPRY